MEQITREEMIGLLGDYLLIMNEQRAPAEEIARVEQAITALQAAEPVAWETTDRYQRRDLFHTEAAAKRATIWHDGRTKIAPLFTLPCPPAKGCDYCDSTGEIETDNNGPIVPCPLCPSAKAESNHGLLKARQVMLQLQNGILGVIQDCATGEAVLGSDRLKQINLAAYEFEKHHDLIMLEQPAKAQAQVTVAITDPADSCEVSSLFDHGYKRGWNACRDAMLSAAQQPERIEATDEILDALTSALAAMEHMGDVLNGMDAVEDEDEKHFPAFHKVRSVIAKMTASPAPEHSEQSPELYLALRNLRQAVEFLEQCKRENPDAATGVWKDAWDWMESTAVSVVNIMRQQKEAER